MISLVSVFNLILTDDLLKLVPVSTFEHMKIYVRLVLSIVGKQETNAGPFSMACTHFEYSSHEFVYYQRD